MQARQQSLRLERLQSFNKSDVHTHSWSHDSFSTVYTTSDQDCRADYNDNRCRHRAMMSLRAAVVGELHITGVFIASASARGNRG